MAMLVVIGGLKSALETNSQKNGGPSGPPLRNSKPAYGTIFNWKNRIGEFVM